MEVVRGHRHASAWQAAAVTIGNFDGVHVGHRALITRAKELAEAHDARTVVLTFDPHPAHVLSPQTAPKLLTSLDRRLQLLDKAGADIVVVEPFTRELAGAAPAAFIDDVVIHSLRANAIVVGHDFTYGQGRLGTTDALRVHGNRAGIEVDILAPVKVGDELASSTRARALLAAGDVLGAARVLGRQWDVDGVVVHGAHRGRELGIPTANIRPGCDLLVKPGIYGVTMEVEGALLPAVASLGTNPTFVDNGGLVLEVHVLDFDGDLYDRRVRITFVGRLRDEAKFDSVDALIAQIHADIVAARRMF